MVGYLLYDVRQRAGQDAERHAVQPASPQGWGPSGPVFVTVTLLSEAVFLFAAAQTGFLSAPRVLSYMSMDRWFPQQFSLLSERFVIKNGHRPHRRGRPGDCCFSPGARCRFMVVLYSINVFITFTLSQLGMVRHWWRDRRDERPTGGRRSS